MRIIFKIVIVTSNLEVILYIYVPCSQMGDRVNLLLLGGHCIKGQLTYYESPHQLWTCYPSTYISMVYVCKTYSMCTVAAPEKLGGGVHRGSKMRIWGGKNQKNCQKWLIFGIFPSDRGRQWGQSLWRGGGDVPSCFPLGAATVCVTYTLETNMLSKHYVYNTFYIYIPFFSKDHYYQGFFFSFAYQPSCSNICQCSSHTNLSLSTHTKKM